MNHEHLTVHSNGFITYCDALIARVSIDKAQSYLFSIVGSASQVQAASAHFFNGGLCRVCDHDEAVFDLGRCQGIVNSIRARKIGDTVNKIMIGVEHFPGAAGSFHEPGTGAVVYGPNLETVKQRAFLRLNSSTDVPLKPEWHEWLWEEVMQPERLYSFGNRQLQEAWMITWPEADLEELVLEGIRKKYLI